MKIDATHISSDTLQKSFSDYLKNKKLRNTAERDAIFSIVCHTKDTFTLEMIGQQLESVNFRVSRASVYNTMELLLDAKIVIRHQFNGINVQYELKHIAEQYSHVICTYCGAVRKIKNDKISSFCADYKIPKFTTEYYTLSFYGLCSKCKYRIAQETIKANKKIKKQNI